MTPFLFLSLPYIAIFVALNFRIMKKALLILAVGALTSLSSCKKCAVCTFNDSTRGELKNEEVCQKGKQYKHVIDTYELNGWTCTKK